MLKISNDNIIINSSGIYVTAESTSPFNDFHLSTSDKISLFTESDELYVSVEEDNDGEMTIYGHTKQRNYDYLLTEENKERIKEEIKNVVKEFV